MRMVVKCGRIESEWGREDAKRYPTKRLCAMSRLEPLPEMVVVRGREGCKQTTWYIGNHPLVSTTASIIRKQMIVIPDSPRTLHSYLVVNYKAD